eukprot:scaffold221240_cov35-Tisochrysis_lutea.AAC.1
MVRESRVYVSSPAEVSNSTTSRPTPASTACASAPTALLIESSNESGSSSACLSASWLAPRPMAAIAS